MALKHLMSCGAIVGLGFCGFVASPLSAQTFPAQPGAGVELNGGSVAPPFTSSAAVYSGISGPGKPVAGNGGGGYRSGYEGLMYDGPDPKPGWLPLGKYVNTSSVVKAGLLPPLKPIWDVHLRDTVFCVGGDGLYYMTGSTGDNIWDRNDGIELWRSKDLQHWDYLGLVWSFEKDATWQKQWRAMRNRPARDVWAPEIHYLKQTKRYVLAYSLAGGTGTGLLLSTSGKPEGPYVNPLKPDARLTGGIDPTIFEDDDGKIYITWGRGGQIAQMKNDLSGFEIPPTNVKVDKSDATAADGTHNVPADLLSRSEVAMEGASLFKRNGKYYLGGAVFWGGTAKGRYDSVVAIADNIWGPYTHWHEAVPCGGGTDYFQDNDGNWWCGYFGNDEQSPFREKPGLVKIDFDKDGKIFIADEQPAFVLQEGAATHWRKAAVSSGAADSASTSSAIGSLTPASSAIASSTPANSTAPNSRATTLPTADHRAGPLFKGTPREGDVVPPPPAKDPELGISGPGALHTDHWFNFQRQVTHSAVTAGLIPDLKPLIPDTQLRDTIVILGGDGNYYLTGSSGNDIWDFNNGIELWKSADLKKWDYLGVVWSFDKDATWERDWRWHHQPVRAIWAPEIHYVKHNYFLATSMPPGNRGILKSVSGKPEGPYVNALANDVLLPGGIDGTLFEDDDGKVYYTNGGAGSISLMKDDMSGFDGPPHKILVQGRTGGPAREGASLFKANGHYYLGGAATVDGRYSSVCAISDNIFGPYHDWHEAVPCGGGTNYFQDKEGNWWCAYFGNDNQASFREMPAIVKVDFDKVTGRIFVAPDQPAFVIKEGSPTHWQTKAPAKP